jgi:hypothetical protein
MSPRTLPILNAMGCLVLSGLIVAQWRKERVLDQSLTAARTGLLAAREQVAAEALRSAAFERDIGVLKEAVEATRMAAEAAGKSLVEKDEAAAALQLELGAVREQVVMWEAAVKARDERIRLLAADLATARKRLDEAIGRLKAAGAK